MSDFRKALIWTAGPLLALGVVNFALGLIIRASGAGGPLFAISFVFGPLLWGIALLTAVGFLLAGRRRIAAGMLAGVGIGLVGLGLTCFGLVSGL